MHLTRIAAIFMLFAVLLGITSRAQLSAPIASVSASETTVTIKRGGLGDCDDSYLYQYDPDNRDVWWISTFRVGYSHPYERGRYSGLLRFDLTPIPAGATIVQARLLLYCDGWSGSGASVTMGAYAVLREAHIRQATWNEAKLGNPWGEPGCSQVGTDRLADPDSVLTVNGTGRWYEMDVMDTVQKWVSGNLANNGLLLQADSGSGFFAFSSSDGSDVSRRPQLVVTYTVGDSTPTATVAPTAVQTPAASLTPTETIVPASPTPTGTVGQPPTPIVTPTSADQEITATLQQGSDGYSGCDDTYIYQWAPDASYCWQEQLRVGYKQQNAALLRFDLSPIPPGAAITQATLQLYASGWSGSDLTFGAYALVRDFDACQATWNRAHSTNPWGLPGCNDTATDRRASPESLVTTTGIGLWYDLDLTAIVGEWVSGNLPNYGVLLRGDSPLATPSIYLASAQSGTASLRPRLVITYRTAANPTPLHTPSPTATAVPSYTHTPTATATLPTASPTPTHTPAPATPTATATATATLSPPSPSHTPSASPSPTLSPTQVPASTPTPTAASTQTTVTLQQGSDGYSGCDDTYIYQWAPDASYCWQEQLRVGYKQQNAALLRFDLSPIPPGAAITQATLQLYANGWSGSDLTFGAYALVRDFDACQATWNRAHSANPWGLPGCNDTATDRRASPESLVTTTGIGLWYDLDLTAIVGEWVSGNLPNYGVLLRGDSPLATPSIYLASAQSGTASLRPRLVITYRTAANPTPTPANTATAAPPTASPTPTYTSAPTTPTATPTATAALPSPSPTSTALTLTLGHITDADIGWSWLESQRLPLVVSTLSQEAEVLVDTGNCTAHGTAEESAEYAELVNGSASIPWRAVMGNHDRPHTFQQYIGPLQWSWDVGGYRLIGINTTQIDYETLDQALTREKPCIIFGHLPLGDLDSTDQDKLRQRFVAYDIPIYVAGHVRYNSLQTDPQSGTLLLTGSRTVRCHYRLITLRGFEVEDVQFKMACS